MRHSPPVAVDLERVFRERGRVLFALLEYCVISRQLEPLFVFLVLRYREIATLDAALALYDPFCRPGAPARLLAADDMLPPRDLRLGAVLEPLRAAREESLRLARESGEPAPRALAPAHLFDDLARALRADARGGLARVAAGFDPALEPARNLPGGRMTPGQRAFVEGPWKRRIRPRLVAAGFREVASLG